MTDDGSWRKSNSHNVVEQHVIVITIAIADSRNEDWGVCRHDYGCFVEPWKTVSRNGTWHVESVGQRPIYIGILETNAIARMLLTMH
jgi:hypothetical protein